MSIILPEDPKDWGFALGKPYTDIIDTPPDIDDTWHDLYEAWVADDTGNVPPPPGYEEWSVERALEDYEAEMDRLRDHITDLWKKAYPDKEF